MVLVKILSRDILKEVQIVTILEIPVLFCENCHESEASFLFLTSELLLPVAGDLAALCLDGLLALGARAGSLAGAQAAVALVGNADAPLPLTAVRLAFFLPCFRQRWNLFSVDYSELDLEFKVLCGAKLTAALLRTVLVNKLTVSQNKADFSVICSLLHKKCAKVK